MVKRKLGVRDCLRFICHTPFLERFWLCRRNTFPLVSSDFSLMDAIECGIVKLPRVPVSDNVARP